MVPGPRRDRVGTETADNRVIAVRGRDGVAGADLRSNRHELADQVFPAVGQVAQSAVAKDPDRVPHSVVINSQPPVAEDDV